MSNEATIRLSASITRAGLTPWRLAASAFRKTLYSPVAGPTPSYLTITTSGENIAFPELITPGLCFMTNLDDTDYVTWGIYVGGATFYPIAEIHPGETYPIDLSRDLGEAHTVPGTGTTAPVNTLYMRSRYGPVRVLIEAFEKSTE